MTDQPSKRRLHGGDDEANARKAMRLRDFEARRQVARKLYTGPSQVLRRFFPGDIFVESSFSVFVAPRQVCLDDSMDLVLLRGEMLLDTGKSMPDLTIQVPTLLYISMELLAGFADMAAHQADSSEARDRGHERNLWTLEGVFFPSTGFLEARMATLLERITDEPVPRLVSRHCLSVGASDSDESPAEQ